MTEEEATVLDALLELFIVVTFIDVCIAESLGLGKDVVLDFFQ